MRPPLEELELQDWLAMSSHQHGFAKSSEILLNECEDERDQNVQSFLFVCSQNEKYFSCVFAIDSRM